MTPRLVIYDDVMQLHLPDGERLAEGDELDVYRGNGPRDGERMGVATVLRFDEHGELDLDVRLGT